MQALKTVDPSTEAAVARANYDAYIRARDSGGHEEYVREATRKSNYYLGDQWDPIDRQTLRQEKRPAETVNMILGIVNTVQGEHIANRAEEIYEPIQNDPASIETAAALTKLAMHVNQRNKLDFVEDDVVSDGIIEDRGFFDIRVGYDDHMKGNIDITSLDPRTVVLDPDAKEYDPRTWKEVTVSDWYSVDDIREQYGDEVADRLMSMGPALSMDSGRFDSGSSTFGTPRGEAPDPFVAALNSDGDERRRLRAVRVIDRQYYKLSRMPHFVDKRSGDIKQVPPSWDKARYIEFANRLDLMVVWRMVKRVRWTVTCDKFVLHDEWSPYKSFTVVPFFPYFRRGKTMGIVHNLLSPQDILNKSTSQELHIINSTANSGWIVDTGALLNMTPDELRAHGSQSGLVIEKRRDSTIEKIRANDVPRGIDTLTARSGQNLKEISGVNDALRGFDRPEVSGVALDRKVARGQLQLQVPLGNLQRTRQILAEKKLELMQDTYTEHRILRVVDPRQLNAEPQELPINQTTVGGRILNDITQGRYTVAVGTMPDRTRFEEQQFSELVELRGIGIEIPGDRILEHSSVTDRFALAEEMRSIAGRGQKTDEEQQLETVQMQLQMAEQQLALEKLGAEVSLLEAQAALAEAKAFTTGDLTAPQWIDAQKDREATIAIKREELALRMRLAELGAVSKLDLMNTSGRQRTDSALVAAAAKQRGDLIGRDSKITVAQLQAERAAQAKSSSTTTTT